MTATTLQSTATQSIPTPPFNAGPLTSITQAPECLDAVIVDISTDTSSTTSVRMQLGFRPTDYQGRFCYPSAYLDALGKSPVFSPGNACPTGYGPSCTLVASGATLSAATTLELWDALASGEIAIGCCVSGYNCAYGSGNRHACESTLTEGDTVTVIYETNKTTTTQEVTADPYTRASIIALRLLYIPEKNISSAHNNTLSQAQAVAIGVSIPLIIIAILVASFYLYRYRKTTINKRLNKDRGIDHPEAFSKPELDASSKIVNSYELDPTPIAELSEHGIESSPKQIAELAGDSMVQDTRVQLDLINIKPSAIRRKPVGKQSAGGEPVRQHLGDENEPKPHLRIQDIKTEETVSKLV